MQNRAKREYATQRGWTIALQVPEVNSGATRDPRGESGSHALADYSSIPLLDGIEKAWTTVHSLRRADPL